MSEFDLLHPSAEHKMLREMVRDFTQSQIEPQAEAFDESGTMNLPLFRAVGELGLLGVTIPERWGGAGMTPPRPRSCTRSSAAATRASPRPTRRPRCCSWTTSSPAPRAGRRRRGRPRASPASGGPAGG